MRSRRAWLAGAALAATVLAGWNLAVPGLYYDEALFCNAALGAPSDTFVALRWRGIPVLLMDYIGALKAWLYFPIFCVTPVNPWTVRIPAILAGVAGGVLLVAACRRLCGRAAAAFATPLVLLDPGLLMHSRLDWGPTALMFLCRGMCVYGIAIWWRRGTPGGLWLTVGAGALGLFDKLNFLWIFAAAAIALIVAARDKCRAYAQRHPVAAGGQAVAVVILLVAGLWRARGIVNAGLGPSGQSWSDRSHVAWFLLWHAVVGDGPLQFVGTNGVEPARWMVPAYWLLVAVSLACLIAGRRRFAVRPWLFVLLFTLLVAGAFAATKSATGPHHSAVIAGLPGLVLAPLLAAGAARGAGVRMVEKPLAIIALAVTAVMAGCMVATSVTSIRTFARPGNRAWDPAHNRLAEFAEAHSAAVFRTADWGIGTQIIGLTEGRVQVDDNWPQFATAASAVQALQARPRDRDLYVVVHAAGGEVFPAARRGLDQALGELGLVPTEVARLTGIDGRPLILILQIPRPAADQSGLR